MEIQRKNQLYNKAVRIIIHNCPGVLYDCSCIAGSWPVHPPSHCTWVPSAPSATSWGRTGLCAVWNGAWWVRCLEWGVVSTLPGMGRGEYAVWNGAWWVRCLPCTQEMMLYSLMDISVSPIVIIPHKWVWEWRILVAVTLVSQPVVCLHNVHGTSLWIELQ